MARFFIGLPGMMISIGENSDFLVRLPHQEALNEMGQQIYFQINEVLRTFQIK